MSQSRQYLAHAIRALSMDAVQTANSGHPGAPMGMADIAEVLWNDYLTHNPKNPAWSNRDRFILSNGHGSMLLYSLLHLSGYDLSIDDLKNFRQLDSKTPGHPEYGYAPGVETTTGPLGQGIANAVGMALAEKMLAAQFNKPGLDIVDHSSYVFLGDGCLMEGISHEVCSLAGTLGLGKLIAFYDDNNISIDGEVQGWFTDDTVERFKAYNWQVIPRIDGHDAGAIKAAIETAKADPSRPTLICCKTVIGFGSPNKQGTESCHGAPLGADEIAAARKQLNWEHEAFSIPSEVYSGWDSTEKGQADEDKWQQLFDSYAVKYPKLASEYLRRIAGDLPANFAAQADVFIKGCQNSSEKIASRKASQNSIEEFAAKLPELLGGSADLAGSNLTLWSGSKGISADDASGNYVYYGVREFGMAAIMNGVALHGGFVPYGATFLMFMEYCRNAIRMAALMKQRSLFVFTHDSVGLGEDGPTHQPVEQLTSLRSTPNLNTWRPCDTVETAVAWQHAIENKNGPSALVFSRQALTCQPRSDEQLKQVKRGGYVLVDCNESPDILLIATGSEIGITVEAAEKLKEMGVNVNVVSMPCAEVFMQQDAEYRESVLPSNVYSRIAVEAAHPDYWHKFVGLDGRIVGINCFGESAPGPVLMQHFGMTVDNIIEQAQELLG